MAAKGQGLTKPLENKAARESVRAALFGGTAELPTIGRYRIAKRIGGGGMGEVFAAEDPELGRMVAIKLVRNDCVSDRAKRRIKTEARAMAKISHPNVAAVYEVGEDRGQVYIAMELVEGVDLDRWAKAERRSWRDVLDVYLQAGAGLAAAHAASLVHRDFKPHNAVLGDDGRVRVLDFGLVGEDDRTVDEEDTGEFEPTDMVRSRVTESGALVGSPAYMSPEQYERRPATAASDQFSFCIALHEALYARRPFEGKTIPELAARIIEGDVELGSDPAVPGWIRECLRRGLQVDPQRRWPSMDDLLTALRNDPRRRRRLVALGSATLVGAIAVSGWLVLDHRNRSTQCDERAQGLAEHWGPTRAQAVEAAMVAVDRSHAAQTWQKTKPVLDDYALRWADLQQGVCRQQLGLDSSVELPEGQLDSASRCLARAASRFEALVATLGDANTEAVDEAVQAAAGLPWLPGCTDPTWLQHLPPSPQGDDLDVAAQIDHDIADAESRARTEQLQAAQDASERAVTRAAELDDEPLRAEAEYIHGQVLARRGEYADSAKTLERAFLRADASGYDQLALRIATTLSHQLSYRGENADKAILWQELAESRLQRLGLQDHLLAAEVLDSRAILEEKRGRHEEARDASARALSVRERVLGPEHPALIGTLNTLGSEYNKLGLAEDAMATHQRALQIAESQLGADHRRVGVALSAIGRVDLAEARFEEAIPLFERALRIEESWSGPNHADVGAVLNNLGIALEMTNQFDRALSTYQRALSIWENAYGPNHPDVALVLTSIGAVEEARGHAAESLAANERALAIYEATLGPDHPNVATALIQIAGHHRKSGEYETAIAEYTRAHDILVSALGEHHDFVAVPLMGLGDLHRSRGDAGAGLTFYEQALDVRLAAEANPIDLAEAKFSVGRALVESGGDSERALRLGEEAQGLLADIPSEAKLADRVDRWLEQTRG